MKQLAYFSLFSGNFVPSTLIFCFFLDFFLDAFPGFPGSLQPWIYRNTWKIFSSLQKDHYLKVSVGFWDLGFRNLTNAHENLLFIVAFFPSYVQIMERKPIRFKKHF